MSTPQADPGQLIPLGAVAAHNIAAFLNLPVEHVGTIEQAIKDEINLMSSHFTLAVADVMTQHEVELAKIKAEHAEVAAALKADYDKTIAELRSQMGF